MGKEIESGKEAIVYIGTLQRITAEKRGTDCIIMVTVPLLFNSSGVGHDSCNWLLYELTAKE